MRNTLQTLSLIFIIFNLSAQNLVKDIATSDANTIFKNYSQLITIPRNDSLMLVDDKNLIYLFKNNPDTLISKSNWSASNNGIIRGIFKIKNFYVVLSQSNQTDYLVKITDNNPPVIVWTSGSSGTAGILNINQIGQKLIFLDSNPNVCSCKRLVVHNGEYEGGTVIRTAGQFTYMSDVNIIDNKLYFSANFTDGYEPWVSDGTAAGTFQLGDLNPGSASSSPAQFIKFDNNVYFRAGIGNKDWLFQTDGTQQGTSPLYSNYNLYLGNFVKKNNDFFAANNSRLIKVNLPSQSQTELLPFDIFSLNTFIINDEVYFLIYVHNQNTGKKDIQLYKYDGTNMILIKTLQTGLYHAYTKMWQTQGRVFFEIQNVEIYLPSKSFYEIWTTDGSANGTKKMSELNPAISSRNIAGAIGPMSNYLYFVAYNNEVGYELFKTDGTAINTKLTSNYNKSIVGSWPNTFFEFNNRVYFMADNNKDGRQLWSSDGTLQGTKQEFNWSESVNDNNANLGGSIYNYTRDFGILGNKLIYVNPNSRTLRAFDATTQTDTELKSQQPLSQYYDEYYTAKRYTSLTKLNNEYIFVENLNTLWKTNSTSAGTNSFYYFASFYANPNNFLKVNNEVFFTTENPRAFWRTNGQNSGTQIIQGLSTDQYIIPFFKHLVLGNKAYYIVQNANLTTGSELWEVSTNGAILISSNLYSNGFQNLIVTDNNLYFKTKVNNDYYLMKRDINGNTSIVFSSSVEVTDLFSFKNKIYYTKLFGSQMWLYSTDGTPNSETPVMQLSNNYANTKKIKVDANVFAIKIEKYYPERISEIWISDGTTNNTKKVFDIPFSSTYEERPNTSEHLYENSVNVEEESIFSNNKLFFTMRGYKSGRELWVMDFSCPTQILLSSAQNTNTRYVSGGEIQINTSIEPNVKTILEANNSILIKPGTEIKSTSIFTAEIKGCGY